MLTVQQVDNTNSVIQRKGFADFAHSTHLIELKYKFCNRFRSFEQRKMFWSKFLKHFHINKMCTYR